MPKSCWDLFSEIPQKDAAKIKTRSRKQDLNYLSLDAPRARTMGSAISSMDCRIEATTMKRMMERRKALWMT